MEITKKEVEKLLGFEISSFKVKKIWRGPKCRVHITAVKLHDIEEVVIKFTPRQDN